jgi:hypothetical protein
MIPLPSLLTITLAKFMTDNPEHYFLTENLNRPSLALIDSSVLVF